MGLFQIRSIACGENHTLALVDVDMGQVDEVVEDNQEEIKYQQESESSKVTRLFVWGCGAQM